MYETGVSQSHRQSLQDSAAVLAHPIIVFLQMTKGTVCMTDLYEGKPHNYGLRDQTKGIKR